MIVEHLENESRNAVRKHAEICALTCDDNSSVYTINSSLARIFLNMTDFMQILISSEVNIPVTYKPSILLLRSVCVSLHQVMHDAFSMLNL